jgi:hypothetical protein
LPGRIRNIVLEPIYKGRHFCERNEVYHPDDVLRRPHYRPAHREKWIARAVPAIVTEKLWEQANAALKANASLAHSHTDREYLLTGLIQWAYCGQRKLIATTLRNRTYYRCGGRKANYNAAGVACKSPHLRGDSLEQSDELHHLFKNPGPTLWAIDEQISAQYGPGPDRRIGEERAEVEIALAGLKERRMEYHRQRGRGRLKDAEYDRLLKEAEEKEAPLQKRGWSDWSGWTPTCSCGRLPAMRPARCSTNTAQRFSPAS